MVSAVKSRPNHYEVLGLAPAASDAEILRAFASGISMFRPRPFGGVAEVSIAYETLRDPIKRRAYDASLGLAPEPPRPPAPPRDEAPFITSAPAVAAKPNPQPRHEPPAEPRTASFIAASLRPPEPPHRPEPEARHNLEQRSGGDPVPHRAEEAPDAEDQPFAWQRMAMIMAALVGAVGLLGAWAGSEAGNDAGQPEGALTVALPRAEMPPTTIARAPAPEPSAAPQVRMADAAMANSRARPAVAVREAELAPLPQPELADRQPVAASPEPTPAAEGASEQAAAETPSAAAIPASLPLPNATIARTIGRIGYACGEVTSANAVEGEAPGVFKVVCTSGQSYRAAPLRGRYHFRRWSAE